MCAVSRAPEATSDVVTIQRLTIATGSDDVGPGTSEAVVRDFDTVSQVALEIARRTGRVTNMNLREVAAITPDEAREVFQALMDDGLLARRGVKRGTHYVLPDPDEPSGLTPADLEPVHAGPADRSPAPLPPSPAPSRSADTPLRRLLRRGR